MRTIAHTNRSMGLNKGDEVVHTDTYFASGNWCAEVYHPESDRTLVIPLSMLA